MTRTARQKAIRKARTQGLAERPGCPHPNKRAYPDETAVKAALNRSRASGKPIGIYTCKCGSLHLTRRPRKE